MHFQKLVFDWAASQSAITGAAVLGAGLVYGLFGLRGIRFLLPLPTAGIGCLLGWLAASYGNLPVIPCLGGGSLLGLILGIACPRGSTIIVGGATWAALAGYLTNRFGAPDPITLGAMTLFGIGGLVLTAVSRAAMTVLFTTLQGAGLVVVGFVALASDAIPSLGHTFRAMANGHAILVPILLGMVCVTAYSYQASARRGDLFTGMGAEPTS